METLDLRLQVSGHQLVDSDVRRILNDIQAFIPLSHTARTKFLKNIKIRPDTLVLQTQQAAVIIDEHWVVSIHAHKLHQCVSAMVVFLNEIGEAMGTRISIEVLDRVNDDGLPLARALERQVRMERVGQYVEKGIILIFGALFGALFSLAGVIGWDLLT